jgi:hypothetical protein
MKTSLLLFVSLFLFGCNKNLWVDREHHIDFSEYKTYAWNQFRDGPGDLYHFQRETDMVLKPEINRMMEKNGFVLVPDEEADVFIDYHYFVKENYFEQVYCPEGYYGSSGFVSSIVPGPRCEMPERMLTFDSGNFVIDIVDVRRGQIIWRGNSFEVIENPKYTMEILRKKVKQILKKYPNKLTRN